MLLQPKHVSSEGERQPRMWEESPALSQMFAILLCV